MIEEYCGLFEDQGFRMSGHRDKTQVDGVLQKPKQL